MWISFAELGNDKYEMEVVLERMDTGTHTSFLLFSLPLHAHALVLEIITLVLGPSLLDQHVPIFDHVKMNSF